jgi:hypothetical protein
MELRNPLVQPLRVTAGEVGFAHNGIDSRRTELKQRFEGVARGMRDISLARGDFPGHLLRGRRVVHE